MNFESIACIRPALPVDSLLEKSFFIASIKNMRIGIDIRLIGKKRTGDEQVFFNLVKNLSKIDSENEYFLFIDRDPENNPELSKDIAKLKLKSNFKIIFIDSPNRFWWNLWSLPNHLRKNLVDIFHSQYIAPFWLPKNVKLILTIHDISFNFFPEFIKLSDLFFLKLLIPRSLKMAAKIVAVSCFTKSEIVKYYHIPPEKISVAPNGVDFGLFDQEVSIDELKRIRKKYNLPEKFVLYIGTLQPRKNIPTLIEAMKNIDAKLVIAGNRNAHNFDPRIDETIDKDDLKKKIIFPGWIEEGDKPVLYKLARCFAFPSLYEGFGIPILEAIAAGTPVVCSDQRALVEVGSGAILASEPGSPEKMAENLEKILTDENLREKLIEMGKIQAQKFSWQKTAEKTKGIYSSLA
jgi:glycosyltransferase involved in cell wall biosynthesis